LKNQKDDNSEWINPALREIEREKIITFKDKSRSYLPLNLTLFESVVYTESKTSIGIPLTISIKTKEGKTKILIIKIAGGNDDTVTNNSKYSKIAHHLQVPMDNKTLQHFMLDPVNGAKQHMVNKDCCSCQSLIQRFPLILKILTLFSKQTNINIRK
jgi:hypothetical protein